MGRYAEAEPHLRAALAAFDDPPPPAARPLDAQPSADAGDIASVPSLAFARLPSLGTHSSGGAGELDVCTSRLSSPGSVASGSVHDVGVGKGSGGGRCRWPALTAMPSGTSELQLRSGSLHTSASLDSALAEPLQDDSMSGREARHLHVSILFQLALSLFQQGIGVGHTAHGGGCGDVVDIRVGNRFLSTVERLPADAVAPAAQRAMRRQVQQAARMLARASCLLTTARLSHVTQLMLADVADAQGACQTEVGNVMRGLQHHQHALSLRSRRLPPAHLLCGHSHLNIGLAFCRLDVRPLFCATLLFVWPCRLHAARVVVDPEVVGLHVVTCSWVVGDLSRGSQFVTSRTACRRTRRRCGI